MPHLAGALHSTGRQVSSLSSPAANATAGEVIIVALAGPLRALSSSTSNDVVVGSNFTTDGFTSQNSGTGKLIALAIFTNATSVNNDGCALAAATSVS